MLNHPNILRVYDADVDGSSYYLVSEWLERKSLRDEGVAWTVNLSAGNRIVRCACQKGLALKR